MTHKEILEQTKSELDRLVSDAKRKLDDLYRPKLEVGEWYWKSNHEYRILFCFQGDVGLHFGFNGTGDWSKGVGDEGNETAIKANYQEVETALVKEAKRRGLLYGVNIISPNGEDWGYKVTSNDFRFDQVNNTLYSTYNLGGTVFLFKDGKWAKPVEEGKFAELKEAYKNGAVMQ